VQITYQFRLYPTFEQEELIAKSGEVAQTRSAAAVPQNARFPQPAEGQTESREHPPESGAAAKRFLAQAITSLRDMT
jgi:transposase